MTPLAGAPKSGAKTSDNICSSGLGETLPVESQERVRKCGFTLDSGKLDFSTSEAISAWCEVHGAQRAYSDCESVEVRRVAGRQADRQGCCEYLFLDFGDGSGGVSICVVTVPNGGSDLVTVTPLMPDEAESVSLHLYL